MQLINSQAFHALVEHLEAEAPDLVPVCRWLACGPRLASSILGAGARQPTEKELARLAGALESAPSSTALAGRALLAAHSRLIAAAGVALERLLAAGDDVWSHPTEILGRPCPSFRDILKACRTRLDTAPDADVAHLEAVAAKLERAARIEAKALRRREGAA